MILKTFLSFLYAFKNTISFLSLDQSKRKIVFYAEDAYSMLHFKEIIRCLVENYKEEVCYLTSELDDPILKAHSSKVRPFYIGHGCLRTELFRTMRADLMIMTMPDLETFHLKRSKVYPVHYLYLFHTMVSTHLIYRKAAFDNYDTIFCVGPFHITEIRETEKVYGLPEKQLVPVGYGMLETLIKEERNYRNKFGAPCSGKKTILIAPSWGKNEILEHCGVELIKVLLGAGYKTILRPHPNVINQKPQVINNIKTLFKDDENFQLNLDMRENSSLFESHLMISDWSGVAFEYAFVCERPVIFIDIPKKCNNPETEKITQIPIEVSIRNKVGRIVLPSELHILPKLIEDLHNNKDRFVSGIKVLRQKCVFNFGFSNQIAAERIKEIANKQCQ